MKQLLKYIPILFLFTFNLSYGGDGIEFIENKGQWSAQVNFKADLKGGKIWLEKNKITYQFTKYPNLHANFKSKEKAIVYQHVVWAKFIGVNDEFEITKNCPSKHYTNYFIGNDESKWASNCHSYSDIKYINFYDYTDFRMYKKEGQIKYDFILKPGSQNNIKISYQGQDKIKINKKGALIIYTSLGQIIEEK